MDVHSPEQRSFNMSRIRGKDTRPEMMVRGWLWANGYRYRLHRKDLPGKPDIVLPKYRAVIFVHGCFWHRHGCQSTTTPESRRDFWLAKFSENVSRDKRNIAALLEQSWRVMVIWECSLRGKNATPELVAEQIADFLNSETRFAESGTQWKREGKDG
jgi:DNA mismatch endonuclease (patch repair protein)